jgi:hypothetical protein
MSHPVRLLAAHLLGARFGPFLDVDHLDSPSKTLTTILAEKPVSVSA